MATAFVRSGRLIAAVAAREGWPSVQDPSLLIDTLLAASCRDAGIMLVTQDGDCDWFVPFIEGWRHLRPSPDVI